MILDIEELNRRLTDKGNIANRYRKPTMPVVDVEDTNENPNPAPVEDTPVLPQAINKPVELAVRRLTTDAEHRGGRFTGQPNLPPIMRELIGTCASLSGSTKAARAFDVSIAHTQNLKDGKLSGQTLPPLKLAIEQNVQEVRKHVIDTMKSVVSGIPERLTLEKETLTAKDLSVIAKNLSAIMAATKDKEKAEEDNNVHFHVHVPPTKTIDQYPVIEA